VSRPTAVCLLHKQRGLSVAQSGPACRDIKNHRGQSSCNRWADRTRWFGCPPPYAMQHRVRRVTVETWQQSLRPARPTVMQLQSASVCLPPCSHSAPLQTSEEITLTHQHTSSP
jgi:hypothetical protein